MWKPKTLQLNPTTFQYQLFEGGESLSYKKVLDLWQEDANFSIFFHDILANNPFEAYFFEVIPVNKASINNIFEFVLVESPALARISADSRPFQEKFNDQAIIDFPNLRGDAHLVAPNALRFPQQFPHLATFVRQANLDLIHEFWKKIAICMKKIITTTPRWLSTSGLGVYWLHIRIDSYPKYYTFKPYRTFSP